MEREKFALRRGATPYGRIKAVHVSGGPAAMGHYESSGQQMTRCIQRAIDQSGLAPTAINHISASANFSGELDRAECAILMQTFKKGPQDLWVSPLKYLMGDFGGAGVTRAAAILLGFRHELAVPTLAAGVLQQSGQVPMEWDLNPGDQPTHALMLSATFGGGSSCIIWEA
jgi:3-oxoacyl-(acyl-carrier-protein) synthase